MKKSDSLKLLARSPALWRRAASFLFLPSFRLYVWRILFVCQVSQLAARRSAQCTIYQRSESLRELGVWLETGTGLFFFFFSLIFAQSEESIYNSHCRGLAQPFCPQHVFWLSLHPNWMFRAEVKLVKVQGNIDRNNYTGSQSLKEVLSSSNYYILHRGCNKHM